MDTFLAPIEKPSSLVMKLAYFFTRKQFGKVLTPLKVHSARLPAAFGMFYGWKCSIKLHYWILNRFGKHYFEFSGIKFDSLVASQNK